MKPERLTWEEYALMVAFIASLRSEDPYIKVGACILRKDHTIASIGYNGAPPGIDIDWSNREERRKRVIHAECNALRYCRPYEGELIAITISPCLACLKQIVAYGIRKVIYFEPYPEEFESTYKIAQEFGITFQQYSYSTIFQKILYTIPSKLQKIFYKCLASANKGIGEGPFKEENAP